ncbi:TIGR01458 family HAD-type hydrolase [Methylocystis sp. IM2]|uniref:TIGR01458 family HAD-type hydrolase n=1 Tax=Methylocystis sp. IM2 TaxID=3136563 RepID=UPI0030FC6140
MSCSTASLPYWSSAAERPTSRRRRLDNFWRICTAAVPASHGAVNAPEGVLIDLDAVVYVGDAALPGSLEAIERLRAAGLPYRFVTNTTRRPLRRIVEDLPRLGLSVSPEEIYTPAALARSFLLQRGLAPFLVTHPDLQEEFADIAAGSGEAVVIGDAGEFFTYDLLNRAYRKIIGGAVFLALAKNRCFLDRDGELSLDAGRFVKGLEFASGREALVLGKPSPTFFSLAVSGLHRPADRVAMIGDDAEADVGGAMAAGLMGVLVRTGKYPDRTGGAAPPAAHLCGGESRGRRRLAVGIP